MKKRKDLGGSLPYRNQKASKLIVPDISIFQEMLDGSGDREVSTTMSYVRFLTLLSKDKHGKAFLNYSTFTLIYSYEDFPPSKARTFN